MLKKIKICPNNKKKWNVLMFPYKFETKIIKIKNVTFWKFLQSKCSQSSEFI
jgi:hypothetical protein